MARGKKTEPEMIYKVMALWFTNYNMRETARQLDMPLTTVKDIVDGNIDKDEFKKLREEKQDEFAEKASGIIDMLLDRIIKEVSDDEKDIPLHHLTTAIGTLYDKRALSRGEMTQNLGFATNLDLDKLVDIAGYTKKADDSE